MPSIEVSIVLDLEKLEDFARRYNTTIDRAVGGVAAQTTAIAKTLSPHDTGNLRNSINFKHAGECEYIVHDGVHYGIYWEMGFHPWGKGRLMQQPFLVPALREAAQRYMYDKIKEELHKDFGT